MTRIQLRIVSIRARGRSDQTGTRSWWNCNSPGSPQTRSQFRHGWFISASAELLPELIGHDAVLSNVAGEESHSFPCRQFQEIPSEIE